MSEAPVPVVESCIGLVQDAVAPGGPLSILVLGDPDARVCRAAAATGAVVECCPDLQRSRTGESRHASVVCDRATDLLGSDVHYDLIMAIDGWARLLDTHPPATRDLLIDWMRLHGTVSLVEAPRRTLAPDLNALGPFDVHAMLGGFRFLAEPTGVAGHDDLDTPLVLASDAHLLVGEEWVAEVDVQWLGQDAPDAPVKPVRTFLVPGDRIVKVECTSEDYFERAQVVGEWAFLDGATDVERTRLGLPQVHALLRGRAVATLVRDAVPGQPGDDLSVDERIAGTLDIVGRYASEGVFHNDIRPWNLLWEGTRARFVDFADTSLDDDDVRDLPQVLSLAGTLAAMATDDIRGGEHFHGDVLEVASRSGALLRWPLWRQLSEPWDRVPSLVPGRDVAEGMSADEIVMNVLEQTIG